MHIAISNDEKVDCIEPAESRFDFEMHVLPDDDLLQVVLSCKATTGASCCLAILARRTH